MLLRSGSTGEEVHDLQAELEVLGFYKPVFDGRTKKAVIAFQRSVGLVPDGVVGPQTSGALHAALRRRVARAQGKEGSASTNSVTGGRSSVGNISQEGGLDLSVSDHTWEVLDDTLHVTTNGQWYEALQGEFSPDWTPACGYGPGRVHFLTREEVEEAVKAGQLPSTALDELGDAPGAWVVTCGALGIGRSSRLKSGEMMPTMHCSSFVNFILSTLTGLNERYTHPGNMPHLNVLSTKTIKELHPHKVGEDADGNPRFAHFRGFGEHLARLHPDGSSAKRHKLKGRSAARYMDTREIWERRDELGPITVFAQSDVGLKRQEYHVGFLFKVAGMPDCFLRVAADGYRHRGKGRLYSGTPLDVEVIREEEALRMRRNGKKTKLFTLFRVHSLPETTVQCPVLLEKQPES